MDLAPLVRCQAAGRSQSITAWSSASSARPSTRWICDYTWSGIWNQETIRSAPKEAMQFGNSFERVLREVLLADPKFGPVFLNLNETDFGSQMYQ